MSYPDEAYKSGSCWWDPQGQLVEIIAINGDADSITYMFESTKVVRTVRLSEWSRSFVWTVPAKTNSPQAPDDTVTNERGGKQSRIRSRISLFPLDVLAAVLGVLADGADKYGKDNWKSISVEDHLDHAVRHILRFMGGAAPFSELYNALCRLAFAAHLAKKEAGE